MLFLLLVNTVRKIITQAADRPRLGTDGHRIADDHSIGCVARLETDQGAVYLKSVFCLK